MVDNGIQVVVEDSLSPDEKSAIQARRQRFERNWAWLEAHASEVYSHRSKFICIAGQELFVGDTPEISGQWLFCHDGILRPITRGAVLTVCGGHSSPTPV